MSVRVGSADGVTDWVQPTGLAEMFEGAEAKWRRFAEHYARVAQSAGAFLDTGHVNASNDLDGIHLQASGHEKPGVAVAAKVRELAF